MTIPGTQYLFRIRYCVPRTTGYFFFRVFELLAACNAEGGASDRARGKSNPANTRRKTERRARRPSANQSFFNLVIVRGGRTRTRRKEKGDKDKNPVETADALHDSGGEPFR